MGTLPSKRISQVVERFAMQAELSTFVETGTFRGVTTRWASERFVKVESIEIDFETYEAARKSLFDRSNVTCHHGDSRDRLTEIVQNLTGAAVFWLDAHKGGGWFGSGDDCPILEELAIINASVHPSLILIDDARGFMSPPPPPFEWRAWPDLRSVLNHACGSPERFAAIIDDVIVCVPLMWRDRLREHLHSVYPKLQSS